MAEIFSQGQIISNTNTYLIHKTVTNYFQGRIVKFIRERAKEGPLIYEKEIHLIDFKEIDGGE